MIKPRLLMLEFLKIIVFFHERQQKKYQVHQKVLRLKNFIEV